MRHLAAAIAGLCCAAVGFAAVAALFWFAGSAAGMSDFEGGLSMTAFFFAGPVGGVAGLLTGIWLVLRRGGRATRPQLALGVPAVLAGLAVAAALGGWYLYETRPLLGGSSRGTPRLDFELRVAPPLQAAMAGAAVELHTSENRMPGELDAAPPPPLGGEATLPGSVELAYRSSWRLLEFRPKGSDIGYVFRLDLPARPGHMRDWSPWRPVDLMARGADEPEDAPPDAGLELRVRVVYPLDELEERAPER